jgi:hypothetical protein
MHMRNSYRGFLVAASTVTLFMSACSPAPQAPTSQITSPAPAQSAAPTASSAAAQMEGTPPGTVMTPEYVATVARFAYVWGWPLVNNYNRSLAMAKLPGPGRMGDTIPAAPPGYVSMLTDYISYKEQFVTLRAVASHRRAI